ncbi:MAG TPA: carbohydrate-binding domain-containing protein, partial [Oscillospiraceae bacterium]|nr:carbohydrate-binding domain-containing protein [Oscillospiraceae bacterium]
MKKWVSLAVCLFMVLTLLPVGAAAYVSTVSIAGDDLMNGYYLPSVGGTPTEIGATTPASYVAMYQDGVLTLNNLEITEYTGEYGIFYDNTLTIVLEGDNVIGSEIQCPSTASICSEGTLTIQGSGSLTAYGGYEALNGFDGIHIESGDLTLYAQYPIDAYDNSLEEGRFLTISGGTILADGTYTGVYCSDGMISGGTLSTSGSDTGIYAGKTLTVTGGYVTANGGNAAIFVKDIELGSRVIVRTGGTIRKTVVYTDVEGSAVYAKTETEGGLTKYYEGTTEGNDFSEITEEAFLSAISAPAEESGYASTFSDSDEVYFSIISDSFVNASTKVVLRTRSASSRDDDDDDEPVITGKVTSYEELSRLSNDYKAMKEYADTLGLGDAQVIGTWDIEMKGFAPWKIIFHLDAKYLGDTLTIIHKKDDGTFEFFTDVVDKS